MRFTKFRESHFLLPVVLFTAFTTGVLFSAKESCAHERRGHPREWAKNWQVEYEYKVIDATSREGTLNK